MKYLLILAVLFTLFALVYWRLRPYIAALRRFLGFVRDLRGGVSTGNSSEPLRPAHKTSDRLVRCASCDTWIPAARAVKLRSSSNYYCSHECLEGQPERRKAAGGKRVSSS